MLALRRPRCVLHPVPASQTRQLRSQPRPIPKYTRQWDPTLHNPVIDVPKPPKKPSALDSVPESQTQQQPRPIPTHRHPPLQNSINNILRALKKPPKSAPDRPRCALESAAPTHIAAGQGPPHTVFEVPSPDLDDKRIVIASHSRSLVSREFKKLQSLLNRADCGHRYGMHSYMRRDATRHYRSACRNGRGMYCGSRNMQTSPIHRVVRFA